MTHVSITISMVTVGLALLCLQIGGLEALGVIGAFVVIAGLLVAFIQAWPLVAFSGLVITLLVWFFDHTKERRRVLSSPGLDDFTRL